MPSKLELRGQHPTVSLSAWVVVDGKEAEIYEVENGTDKDGPVVKGWIESKAGKNFEVHLRDSERLYDDDVDIYVDGFNVGGFMIEKRNPQKRRKPVTRCVTWLQISPDQKRRLAFAEIQTTDDEDALALSGATNELGQIKIRVNLVEFKKVKSTGTDEEAYRKAKEIDQQCGSNHKVHETSKKAGSHRLGLGEVRECSVSRSRYVYQVNRTFAHAGTFIFNYRPRDILSAQGVLPRRMAIRNSNKASTSNVNLSDEIDVKEELNPDEDPDEVTKEAAELDATRAEMSKLQETMKAEMAKLQEKMDALQSKKRKIKSEPDAETPKVKRERIASSSLLKASKPGVIDLTELSD